MRMVTGAVLELALLQLARWQELGLEVPVAINVSLHDLADGGFADTVTAGLARHGLAADRLHLEVTEGALVSDPARVLATLGKLDAAGIRLSLDDFGTGHASLTRLKNLPVGEVKIDRHLIVDLAEGNVQDMAVVRSVVDLARALSLRSVAEGVETYAQWEALVELGCDAVQGWYVAPAMSRDAATDWLMEHTEGHRLADRQAGRDATACLAPHVGAAPEGARAARS
jgi:EAL domain-containing protein (putative c-di-GMP-specific phosphodiesterase class I)